MGHLLVVLYCPHVANKITGAIDGNLSANIGYVGSQQKKGLGKVVLVLLERKEREKS